MKRQLILWLLALVSVTWGLAQTNEAATIKLRSSKQGKLYLDVTPVQDQKIMIDWGDGKKVSVTPNWSGRYIFNSEAKGEVVTIYGQAKAIDFNGGYKDPNALTALEFHDQGLIEKIEARGGSIQTLDISGLPKLTHLDVSKNKIERLDISQQPDLEYFLATHNELASLVLGQHPKLREIKVSHNQLPTLRIPDELPSLRILDIEHNAILEVDLGKLPDLRQLNISHNGFTTLNVGTLKKLEKLYAQSNYLTKIDLKSNPALLALDLGANKLTKLDVGQNPDLTSIEVGGNNLKRLDVSKQPRLKLLNINKNEQISHINLSANRYLRTFKADTTNLSGLDLSNCTAIDQVHLRGTRLSPCAFTYLFNTLPPLDRPTGYANILLSFTSWKGADFSILQEKRWKHDIDASADLGTPEACGEVTLALEVSTGGKATIDISGQEVKQFPLQVTKGATVNISTQADEGYELAGVRAVLAEAEEGYLISPEGTTLEADTKLIISFRRKETKLISLTSRISSGSEFALTLRQSTDATSDYVQIDWGSGEWEDVQVTRNQTTASVITGKILGPTIHISGAVNKLSAPEQGIADIKFSGTPDIEEMDLYGNELKEIELGLLSKLRVLNLAINELEKIDVSKNTALQSLTLYGNSDITALDLSANKALVEIDVKNLSLSELTLDLPLLEELNAQGNRIKQLDLGKAKALINLRLAYNPIEVFAPSAPLEHLKLLVLTNSPVKEIKLDNMPAIERLYLSSNSQLQGLKFPSSIRGLNYLDISDCGLDACQLDKIYKAMPIWSESSIGIQDPVTLYNRGQGDKQNEASTSTTSIVTDKGWSVAAIGDGTGCKDTALDQIARGQGYNYYVEKQRLSVLLAAELQGEEIRLYSLSGKLIYRGSGKLEHHLALQRGAYLLEVYHQTNKVLVD